MNITSINQIADEMRADKLRAESEIRNLRGLFAILSTRWHWEINRILSEKRGDLRYVWHIESSVHVDYNRFKSAMETMPQLPIYPKSRLFAAANPGYPPEIINMFIELMQYELTQKWTEIFGQLLSFIVWFQDETIQRSQVALLHDMVHMLGSFLPDLYKTKDVNIEKNAFKKIWMSCYGADTIWQQIADIIFDFYMQYYIHFADTPDTLRPLLRKTYEDFCTKNSIRIIWR
jgi:hypothetical protein